MVEDMDKKLEEVVSFFGLKVQENMKDFVRTHTDPNCNSQNHFVFSFIFLILLQEIPIGRRD